jgi:anti-sigma factor ChrR (cupin superfamily)
LTAVESAAEAAVLTLVVEPGPVRRANAAEVVLGWRTGTVPPLVAAAAALLERRAASWLSDGRRTPPVLLMVNDDDEVVCRGYRRWGRCFSGV